MELYPAIDVRDGRCVRLRQGDFDAETVYSDDPVAVARAFADAGTRWIHVVDLDAARSGAGVNLAVVRQIVASVPCRVQAGGGVRTDAAAAALFEAGVARVVVGTAAVEDPGLVDRLCDAYPQRVAVGLDARGRDVAVRGWVDGTGRDLLELAAGFGAAGVAALVVTEIARDGMLTGPAVDQLTDVLAVTGADVIASGGIGTLEDLTALARLRVAGPAGTRGLAGAIAGRALYEGRFGVAEALAVLAQPAVSGPSPGSPKGPRHRPG